jgi:Recombinase
VDLPASPIQGTGLVWKIPSQSLIRDILCNPFYAGAYVWARRPVTTRLVDGRLEKRQGAMRSAEECRVFIRDHHVGYIDWVTYEENRRIVRRNSVGTVTGTNRWRRYALVRVFWQSSSAADTVGAGYMYGIGVAAVTMPAIFAKATLTVAGSIALD